MKDARRQTPDAKGLSGGERVRSPRQIRSGCLLRFGLFVEATSQADEHSLDVLPLANHRSHGLLVGHPQEHSHKQMGLQFRSGTQRDVDEASEFSIAEPAASLGDVRCYRNRRPPTLRDKAESFRLGERFGERVDTIDNDPTSLPYIEFPKVLHPPVVSPITAKGNTHRSSVFYLSGTANPSTISGRAGVWRLASGVSSYDPTASL